MCQIDFYTNSLPSAPSREESKRKEEPRHPATFAFLQTRLCRAPGHPESDENSRRREMCGSESLVSVEVSQEPGRKQRG